MPSNFDWRAEDDRSWDEYASSEPEEQTPKGGGKRPTWLIILVAVAIVTAAGVFAFFRVRHYVETTAASVEEDVLSSHALVKLAAQENDLELFAPLLSGRDPNWTQNQLSLLDMDMVLDRRPFGLSWRPEETADAISVELSADLQSAEVEYVETYGYGRDGEGGVIQLTQTAVYRLSETRWLLSPPNDDFWGSYVSAKGSYVILTYPERDEAIGSRLASDLEATLGGACRNLDLNCEENWPVDVLLTTDLEAMMGTNSPELYGRAEGQMLLPAPTLVGKPANDASYRALYRGYATFLLSRLMARQAGWECCEQSPFFKALVDIQLNQFGLQSWPLTAEEYRSALRQPLELETVRAFWDEQLTLAEAQERPDYWTIYAFVEYLFSQQDAYSVIGLQRALADSESFNDWISRAGVTGSLNLAEDDWVDYIHRRILEMQREPPVAWPEEDIALICNDGQTGMTNVYRYDPAENKWSVELGDRDFVVMNGLPENQGLILTEQYLDVDQLRTTLWRDGRETIVIYGENFYFSTGIHNPAGNYLVLNSFQQETFADNVYLLDLENCSEVDCPLLQIEGRPVWSPDGSRTLWAVTEGSDAPVGELPLFLGDGRLQAAEPIGSGRSPFWLDNENFAYLQGAEVDVLVKAGTDNPAPEIVLEERELVSLIPELEDSDLVELTDALTNPAAPDLIYITAANRIENKDYLFSFNWRTAEIKRLFTTEDSPGGLLLPRFSPDNRWLALRTNYSIATSTGQRQQDIYLYDTESEMVTTYTMRGEMFLPGRGWSNDGNWLIFKGERNIILSAPNAGYDHLVTYNFRDCTDVTWMK